MKVNRLPRLQTKVIYKAETEVWQATNALDTRSKEALTLKFESCVQETEKNASLQILCPGHLSYITLFLARLFGF